MHGSLGNLKTLSQGAACHAAMGLQQKKRGEQPVGFQGPTSFISFSFLIMPFAVINEFLPFLL
jgi:hypothetical protein